MSYKTLILTAFLLNVVSLPIFAQSAYRFHSHNDYKQAFPFWSAYSNGAASIEVDVFLKNEKLYVTHSEGEIKETDTIESLYLDPLSTLAKEHKLREVQLLIDFKSEAKASLDKLTEVLKGYPELTGHKKLTFIISGNRPTIDDYQHYPDFIEFDHQRLNRFGPNDLNKIALFSFNFKDYSVWNGLGRPTAEDLEKIEKLIAKVEKIGKPIRFWGAPDTKTAWSRLARMGVDFINTDHPSDAAAYLNSLDKRTFKLDTKVPIYNPKFSYSRTEKPKNIIVMIGDGNGLNQISSGMIANRGELNLTQLKNIGLIKTASYDDLITDSAAGGTAIATGHKTNNRAVGTGPEGENLKNLPEILSENGYLNGIITNDNITGATPAAFYAQESERDNSHAILEDLKDSEIDFFVSSGAENHNKIQGEFAQKELSDFNHFEGRTAIYLSDNSIPALKGGTQFPGYVAKVLENLENQDEPYFLMIEGAKIDSNGHTNNIAGIIQEVIDFDRAVGEVLKVADQNKNTLVVITADHETSGFGLMQGDLKNGEIEGGFLTHDHTATMVPLFSYGPKSESFTGVYENTAIFDKILKALEIPLLSE